MHVSLKAVFILFLVIQMALTSPRALLLMERGEGETVKFDLCIESVHRFG